MQAIAAAIATPDEHESETAHDEAPMPLPPIPALPADLAIPRVRTPTLLTSATRALHEAAPNAKDLQHYFEYSSAGIEVLEEGLKDVPFGEFLVDQGVVDRFQLFRALQMQDRVPGVRLGECAAALGYAPIGAIERLYQRFQQLSTVTV